MGEVLVLAEAGGKGVVQRQIDAIHQREMHTEMEEGRRAKEMGEGKAQDAKREEAAGPVRGRVSDRDKGAQAQTQTQTQTQNMVPPVATDVKAAAGQVKGGGSEGNAGRSEGRAERVEGKEGRGRGLEERSIGSRGVDVVNMLKKATSPWQGKPAIRNPKPEP